MSPLASAPTVRGHGAGKRLQDIVRRRFGLITHDHQQAGFERAIDHLAHSLGYPSRDAYLYALASVERDTPEVDALLSAITVGESYFFRDSAQLELIEKRWIPAVVARKGDGQRTVRVWSAGCSQGQEIYTLAMLLDRHLPERERWDVQLFGTDINREALEAAAAGRFRQWSLRATPEWARTRFFEQRDEQWLLKPRIRSVPSFECFNLVDERSPWAPGGGRTFDLILCRNVFIYFSRDAVRSVMSRFTRCLGPHGMLLLGPADIVSESCEGLELESWKRTQYYRARQPDVPDPCRRTHHPRPSRAAPTSSVRSPDLHGALERRPRACRPSEADVQEIESLLRHGAWEAAATAADAWLACHGEAAHMLERTARAKASLGRLDEAATAAERALALEPLNRDAHFIRALVLMERNEVPAAEAALRRAVYVDGEFLEAHYHLGLLLLRRGRRDAGLKSLRNALALAEHADPGAALDLIPDISCTKLAQTLRSELATHTAAGSKQP